MRTEPKEIIVMNSTLTIPSVTLKDNGIYTCRAKIVHNDEKYASVKVIVHGEYMMD